MRASKIVTTEELQRLLAEHRRRAQRVVLAHDCFDLRQVGHVRSLEGARQAGDLLAAIRRRFGR